MKINKELWSLVIQRASVSQVDIWVGNLFPSVDIPYAAKIEIKSGEVVVASQQITTWLKPFSQLSSRFYQLCKFTNLIAHTSYQVEFSVQFNCDDLWEVVQQGKFTTLPDAIPHKNQKPFTIALGSCFANQDDDGRVSKAFTALYEKGDKSVQPDISFLVGDQVYLDIGFASLIPFKFFIRNRIANRYAKNWQSLAGIFTRGANWMLPDDHEYWNDYPFNNLPILALRALKIDSVRNTWETTAKEGATNIQSARMIEVINIGDDLSICLANFRSERTLDKFISDLEFNKLIEWAKHLRCPGVLVIQQLLMDDVTEDGERNLPSFKEQYARLIEALAVSGNDILILSGDVHFGRVASVPFGTKGATLTEVVSSPLSNLRGLLNGFGAGVCTNTPETFPNLNTPHEAVPARAVTYDKAYQVNHLRGRYWTVYPKDRTNEHFMTLSFSKLENGEVELTVNAWLVRQMNPLTGLPSEGFSKPFIAVLAKRHNFN